MSIEASNQAFIVAAYALTWAVILGYVWWLSRTSSRASAEYDRIVKRGEERS